MVSDGIKKITDALDLLI